MWKESKCSNVTSSLKVTEKTKYIFNPHGQGYWKMSKFFYVTFQEDDKFQKQVGQNIFQTSCIFPTQNIQIISPSTISFISQSNFHL